jgi:hypothetical protein
MAADPQMTQIGQAGLALQRSNRRKKSVRLTTDD